MKNLRTGGLGGGSCSGDVYGGVESDSDRGRADLAPQMFTLLNDPTHQAKILKIHKEIGQWLSNEIGI
jgi:hypothetical protein